MFDHGHFAENFPGAKLGKDAPGAGADETGNFHQPIFDEIDAIAGIVFVENFTTGGKMPFLGDKAQGLQFVAAQIAKQSNGFKRGHQRTLYQFRHVIAHFFVAALCKRRWNQWRPPLQCKSKLQMVKIWHRKAKIC
jgi:hypothetical protein